MMRFKNNYKNKVTKTFQKMLILKKSDSNPRFQMKCIHLKSQNPIYQIYNNFYHGKSIIKSLLM